MRCEDYPCCGHTNDDPCASQWYDAPDAFDTTRYPHALCDHEFGECYVEADECEGGWEDCPYGGCSDCDDTEDEGGCEDAAMESALFGDC